MTIAPTQGPRTLEFRIRRAAQRQAFALKKTRRVDRLAIDYGTFGLLDGDRVVVAAGTSLASIEAYLLSGPRQAGKAGGK